MVHGFMPRNTRVTRDIINQHGNRFIVMRKELFQQKRREEDLLDKINSLQTHSRQVSSLSDYTRHIESYLKRMISRALSLITTRWIRARCRVEKQKLIAVKLDRTASDFMNDMNDYNPMMTSSAKAAEYRISFRHIMNEMKYDNTNNTLRVTAHGRKTPNTC
eukprot:772820_1